MKQPPIVLLLFIFAFMLSASPPLHAKPSSESYYLVPVQSRIQVDGVRDIGGEILHRLPEGVVIRTDDEALKALKQRGFAPRKLERDPALPSEKSLREETFHKNGDVGLILDQVAADYPRITRRFTLGTSVEGRPIHGIVVSKDPDVSSDEPEIRIVGCHHGNEFMSVEIPLLLAQYLTENYGEDTFIQSLVNSQEIYIVPLVNPDGRESRDRRNANGVDLNRNYGYMYSTLAGGDGSETGMFSQPEVRAMANQHFERNFSISVSYHTTAAYVNYWWNYTHIASPDETLAIELSERYADISGYTAVNGFDWYQTYGDTNDFSYGSRGGFDWTLETANSDIPAVWAANRPAVLDLMAQANRGVRGVVTDSDTADPLAAMIRFDRPNWPVYTDSGVGDFHRLVSAGTYAFTAWSPGYEAARFDGIVVPEEGGAIRRDVTLTRNDRYYAFQVPACSTRYDNPGITPSALGPPDEEAFSMGRNAMIVLDMLIEMEDHPGNDLLVYEGDPHDGLAYEVLVSDDYAGPWVSLGTGTGDASFDLAAFSESGARYVKIQDLGDASPSGHPGFDLDAVEYFPDPVLPDGDEEFEMDSEPADVEPDADGDADPEDGDMDPGDSDADPDGDAADMENDGDEERLPDGDADRWDSEDDEDVRVDGDSAEEDADAAGDGDVEAPDADESLPDGDDPSSGDGDFEFEVSGDGEGGDRIIPKTTGGWGCQAMPSAGGQSFLLFLILSAFAGIVRRKRA